MMAMRWGTEKKWQRYAMIAVVSLALSWFGRTLLELNSGTPSAPPPPVADSSAPATSGTSAGPAARQLTSAASLDPTLHPEWMARAENTRYTGTSRNIFSRDSLPPSMQQAIEKPISSVRTGRAAPSGPPPPPTIDLKFYGFATEQGGRKLIFLSHGDDVFIAAEGEVVEGRYKVLKIEKNSVLMEDLAYNDNQPLPMTTA